MQQYRKHKKVKLQILNLKPIKRFNVKTKKGQRTFAVNTNTVVQNNISPGKHLIQVGKIKYYIMAENWRPKLLNYFFIFPTHREIKFFVFVLWEDKELHLFLLASPSKRLQTCSSSQIQISFT